MAPHEPFRMHRLPTPQTHQLARHRALTAIRPANVAHVVAPADPLDRVIAELEAALHGLFEDFTGPMWGEMIAQVPG